MFMDEELNERYVKALEAQAKIAFAAHEREQRAWGLRILLGAIAGGIWGVPLALILWRAATGN